jgi:hypothetical protein
MLRQVMVCRCPGSSMLREWEIQAPERLAGPARPRWRTMSVANARDGTTDAASATHRTCLSTPMPQSGSGPLAGNPRPPNTWEEANSPDPQRRPRRPNRCGLCRHLVPLRHQFDFNVREVGPDKAFTSTVHFRRRAPDQLRERKVIRRF